MTDPTVTADQLRSEAATARAAYPKAIEKANSMKFKDSDAFRHEQAQADNLIAQANALEIAAAVWAVAGAIGKIPPPMYVLPGNGMPAEEVVTLVEKLKDDLKEDIGELHRRQTSDA